MVAVDQFEELFTLCASEAERAGFIEDLVTVSGDAEQRALVLVALRADFYGRLASYPSFAELLSASHVLVGPMDRDELARAIEQPALARGWRSSMGWMTRWLPMWQVSPEDCRCCPRRCLSCGGLATGAC